MCVGMRKKRNWQSKKTKMGERTDERVEKRCVEKR